MTNEINNGGAAPSNRQCQYTLASGAQCRRWAARGRHHCTGHAHWLELRASGPVEVPLIEDAASIALLLSQTARALACGHIPPANGRAIIAACRVAQAAITHTLAEAKLKLKLRQLDIPASDFFPESATQSEPSTPPSIQSEAEPASPAESPQNADRSTPPADQERLPSPCDPCIAALRNGAGPDSIDCPRCPVANGGSLESPIKFAPNAARGTLHPERPSRPSSPYPDLSPDPSFRDLKKHWDQALQRAENSISDMYVKRSDETQEEFLAARARPFDQLLTANP